MGSSLEIRGGASGEIGSGSGFGYLGGGINVDNDVRLGLEFRVGNKIGSGVSVGGVGGGLRFSDVVERGCGVGRNIGRVIEIAVNAVAVFVAVVSV